MRNANFFQEVMAETERKFRIFGKALLLVILTLLGNLAIILTGLSLYNRQLVGGFMLGLIAFVLVLALHELCLRWLFTN